MRVVQTGDDPGFGEVCLDIFRPGDPLRSGNFDGNRSIQVVIKRQENLTEPALTKPSEDGVTIDLHRIGTRA